MTNPISDASAQAVQAQAPPAPTPAAPGNIAAPTAASNIGPAVTLSFSNVAGNNMAKGDPDHDGH